MSDPRPPIRLPLIWSGTNWLARVIDTPGNYIMTVETEEHADYYRGMGKLFGATHITQYTMRKAIAVPGSDSAQWSNVRIWLEHNNSPANLRGSHFNEAWIMNPVWAIPEDTWYMIQTSVRNPGTIFEQGQQITAR